MSGCSVQALNFECQVKTWNVYFLDAGTVSEYVGQICISRPLDQGQGHRSKQDCLH